MTRRPTEYNTSPGRKPSPGMQSVTITDPQASSGCPPIAAETELHLASVISLTMPTAWPVSGPGEAASRAPCKTRTATRQSADGTAQEVIELQRGGRDFVQY